MIFTNFSRSALTAGIAVACLTAASTHAMMGRYLAALLGDACLSAGVSAMNVTQGMTHEHEEVFKELYGVKNTEISQLKKDAAKVVPYTPVLIPFGGVLSVGGRVSMMHKSFVAGFLLTTLSMPINGALIVSGYQMRLDQAPDATVDATLQDKLNNTGRNLKEKFKRITNRKNNN